MVDFSKILLYRMVHIENISHILQYGLTHWKSINNNPNYVSIGDNSLIQSRNTKTVSKNKKLGDYIPFYFGSRMPMLHIIQNGFNEVPILEPEKIVYCITTIQNILTLQLEYCFTDGHAAAHLSTVYSSNDIQNITKILDYEAIDATYWKDYPDQQRKKSAEFLIKGDIPISEIIGFAVYNKTAKKQLIALGVETNKIGIRPQFYF